MTKAPSVLVVAYDFPPHAAIGTMRTLRVVRELHARGWNVTVLTGDPSSYLPTTPVDSALVAQVPSEVRVICAASVRPWNRLQALAGSALGSAAPTEEPAGADVPVARDGSQVRSFRGGLKRALAGLSDLVDGALSIPDRESGWLVPALSKGILKQLRAARPDVIYSSSPPWTGMLVAAGLKTALRRPWVADFRDPWARAPWRGDRYGFALRAAGRLERFVVRRADRIVFVAAANRDDFALHYGPAIAAKFDVVPNGCDPAEFDALGAVPVADTGPFELLHAGSLYAGRTPMPLLKAIARAIDRGGLTRDQLKVRFLGVNALKSVDIAGTCRELGIEPIVEFLPRVTREESLRAMRSASGLLLLQPGHTVSVPGKVYEYFAAGRPIFAIAEEGETSDIVRQSGLGVSVTPDDEEAIAVALTAFVTARHAPVAAPPRVLYDGTIRAAQIADILQGTLGANSRGTQLTSMTNVVLPADAGTRTEQRP